MTAHAKQTSANTVDQSSRILRLPSVIAMTGLGRSTIYRLMSESRFPSPVKVSARAVGWRSEDLAAWRANL